MTCEFTCCSTCNAVRERHELSARVIGPLQSKQQQQQKRCSKGEIRVASKPRATCATYLCAPLLLLTMDDAPMRNTTVKGRPSLRLHLEDAMYSWRASLNDITNDAPKLKSFLWSLKRRLQYSSIRSMQPVPNHTVCALYFYCIVLSFFGACSRRRRRPLFIATRRPRLLELPPAERHTQYIVMLRCATLHCAVHQHGGGHGHTS